MDTYSKTLKLYVHLFNKLSINNTYNSFIYKKSQHGNIPKCVSSEMSKCILVHLHDVIQHISEK